MPLSINKHNISAQCPPISSGVPRLRQNPDSVSFGATLKLDSYELLNRLPLRAMDVFSKAQKSFESSDPRSVTLLLQRLFFEDNILKAGSAVFIERGKETPYRGDPILVAGAALESYQISFPLETHLAKYMGESSKNKSWVRTVYEFCKYNVLRCKN